MVEATTGTIGSTEAVATITTIETTVVDLIKESEEVASRIAAVVVAEEENTTLTTDINETQKDNKLSNTLGKHVEYIFGNKTVS